MKLTEEQKKERDLEAKQKSNNFVVALVIVLSIGLLLGFMGTTKKEVKKKEPVKQELVIRNIIMIPGYPVIQTEKTVYLNVSTTTK